MTLDSLLQRATVAAYDHLLNAEQLVRGCRDDILTTGDTAAVEALDGYLSANITAQNRLVDFEQAGIAAFRSKAPSGEENRT